MGGRPSGTGARTRENFSRGSLRVLAEALQLRGVAALLDDPALGEVGLDERAAFTDLLSDWRGAAGKEEIYAMPYIF